MPVVELYSDNEKECGGLTARTLRFFEAVILSRRSPLPSPLGPLSPHFPLHLLHMFFKMESPWLRRKASVCYVLVPAML
jgi:hypothetical protein